MSEDSSGHHNWEDKGGLLQVVEARDAAKHPIMYRKAPPHNKELPSPKMSFKSQIKNPAAD